MLVLAFVALATGVALVRGRALAIDVENDAMKSVGTEEMRAMERRIRGFGEDHLVLLAFEAGAGAPPGVEDERWGALEAALRAVPGVVSVQAWPLAEGALGAQELVVVGLAGGAADFGPALEELERVAREGAPQSWRVSVSGQPAGELVIAREVQAEEGRVLPWIGCGLFVLLLACYRHLGLVAAILLPATAGIVWTRGLYAWLGHEQNPVSVLLPPVLLTVGVAGGVHLIEAYLDELATAGDAGLAVRRALRELRGPATLATTTTVIGFLSLALNAIPAVVDFGVFAAVGVALTFSLSLVAGPALLLLLAPRVARARLDVRGEASGQLAVRGRLARRPRPADPLGGARDLGRRPGRLDAARGRQRSAAHPAAGPSVPA